MKPDPQENGQNLFHEEEQVIAQTEDFLANWPEVKYPAETEKIRDTFSNLLREYKKLYRQTARMIRINDRNQLALRESEKNLRDALDQLRRHKDKLAFEQELIEEIIFKMRQSVSFDSEKIRHILIPVDRTAGDLLFSCRRPDGVRHIFLGDITGHGLPAAIVGPQVSDIFHGMTEKGFASTAILYEINNHLKNKLPVTIYLAACMLELDETTQHLFAWNGGLPEMLIFRNLQIIHRIRSSSLPLGVIGSTLLPLTRTSLTLEPGDKIIMYSDGAVETRCENTLFGQANLENLLIRILTHQEPIEEVVTALKFFSDKETQDDDITLIEVTL